VPAITEYLLIIFLKLKGARWASSKPRSNSENGQRTFTSRLRRSNHPLSSRAMRLALGTHSNTREAGKPPCRTNGHAAWPVWTGHCLAARSLASSQPCPYVHIHAHIRIPVHVLTWQVRFVTRGVQKHGKKLFVFFEGRRRKKK
jgi:hypothetical protein